MDQRHTNEADHPAYAAVREFLSTFGLTLDVQVVGDVVVMTAFDSQGHEVPGFRYITETV